MNKISENMKKISENMYKISENMYKISDSVGILMLAKKTQFLIFLVTRGCVCFLEFFFCGVLVDQ